MFINSPMSDFFFAHRLPFGKVMCNFHYLVQNDVQIAQCTLLIRTLDLLG
jgi:hypothetical protein